jgi:hypothetical protein
VRVSAADAVTVHRDTLFVLSRGVGVTRHAVYRIIKGS